MTDTKEKIESLRLEKERLEESIDALDREIELLEIGDKEKKIGKWFKHYENEYFYVISIDGEYFQAHWIELNEYEIVRFVFNAKCDVYTYFEACGMESVNPKEILDKLEATGYKDILSLLEKQDD